MSSRLRERGAHIGVLLVAAERRFNDELVGALHRAGFRDIRPGHGAVFANIDAGGTRATELASRARMTKQSMGELVADLERKGYVERRSDPTDARALLVVLSDRGRRVDAAADRVIGRLEAVYAAELGERRFAALRSALADFVAVSAEASPPQPGR